MRRHETDFVVDNLSGSETPLVRQMNESSQRINEESTVKSLTEQKKKLIGPGHSADNSDEEELKFEKIRGSNATMSNQVGIATGRASAVLEEGSI